MKTKLPIVLILLAASAVSACSITAPPIPLADVPIYPSAERIDPSQHPVAVAMDRQTKQANANGHKAEISFFLLPKGTTPAQVKEFYVAKLSKMGGTVTITLGDDAPFGSISLSHGMQALEVEYDATTSELPPLLIIDSFIPNGNR